MVLGCLQIAVFSLIAFSVVYVLPFYFLLLQNEGLPHEKYTPYTHVGVERAEHFLNQWVVHISGDPDIANQVAQDLGFHYNGIINGLDNHYLFSKKQHNHKTPEETTFETVGLLNDARVIWTQQQFAKHLRKRAEIQELRRQLRAMSQIYRKETEVSKYEGMFTDEWWPMQWYEQDYRLSNSSKKLDLNIVPVYQELNINGAGVNIIIIDDGMEYTHEDIKDSFAPELSYNFNAEKWDITPRYEDPRNKHGTRCAGELVMKPNNSKCGVGVCYGARVGGVKLLDGETTDLIESKALQFGLDKVDIYSGSWGPPDDGKSMDGPGKLSKAAIDRGIREGRQGKGVLFVFAAGNGKYNGDNCAADGYINSIYTIAIASAREDGQSPFYSEECTGLIATAYSGGISDPVKIITTDVHNTCTCEHSGTSAAAPIAAGVLALALEANPNMTWRDCQHILAWTSEREPLSHVSGWERNARDLWFHSAYGFGLINTFKLVSLAKNWVNVPAQAKCEIALDVGSSTGFSYASSWQRSFNITPCSDTVDEVKYLEHVHATLNIEHPRRGDVRIELTAPSGVKSVLMEPRPQDDCKTGFVDWSILTLKHWGEDPVGEWKFEIFDTKYDGLLDFITRNKGKVKSLKLTLYGTKEMPPHYSTERTYEGLDSE
ncbi:neuroendocrine convertase 1-like isoform X2 [Diaphorina citri]|nr:neuroendocrine convertase 1-like isoform X2 [Diaphorina citri]XP_008476007.1 neuroendocrine convertase 1-like isoform X2 [Diaphorina citri]